MPANMGLARRQEAANRRIDAAVATLAPERTPPPASRNRGFAEMVRAEWLADTLEEMAGSYEEQVLAAPRIDFSDWNDEQLANLATDVGVEDPSAFETRRELIDAIHERVAFEELVEMIGPQDEGIVEGDEVVETNAEDIADGNIDTVVDEAGEETNREQSSELDLDTMNVEDLRNLAAEREIEGRSGMKKAELIAALQAARE